MDSGDFITLSICAEVTPGEGVPLKEALRGFLSAYAVSLREGGCTLIGHIKGMVEGKGDPPLFFSLTSLDGKPQLKGGILQPQSGLRLSMNVIIAGIDKRQASKLLESTLADFFHIPP